MCKDCAGRAQKAVIMLPCALTHTHSFTYKHTRKFFNILDLVTYIKLLFSQKSVVYNVGFKNYFRKPVHLLSFKRQFQKIYSIKNKYLSLLIYRNYRFKFISK
jgi:hypothetical protein